MAEPPGRGAHSFIGKQNNAPDASLVQAPKKQPPAKQQPPPVKQQQHHQPDPSFVESVGDSATSDPSFIRPETPTRGERGVRTRPPPGGPPPFIPPVTAKTPPPGGPPPFIPAVTTKTTTTKKGKKPRENVPRTTVPVIYDEEPEQARPRDYGAKEPVREYYESPFAYEPPERDFVESSFVLSEHKSDYQSFVSPTAKQDPFFTIADPNREPTSIFSTQSQGVAHQVKFRTLAQNIGDGGSVVQVQNREVIFGKGEGETELEPGSTLSAASLGSTFPMAFDNDRFFDVDDGYYHLLKQASDRMNALAEKNDTFRAPDKEMGFFGWLWRAMVRFLMWLTGSDINRLMLTRSLQFNLVYQSAYESFVLGNLIRYFDTDNRSKDAENKRLVFDNRNTSRVVVRTLGTRWNWFFHVNTRVRWNRLFDFISRFPFMNRFFGLGPTENFPATRDHAFRGIIRPIFEGSWITRTLTGQQGVILFDPLAPAQNLAAESTGFEAGNRNQLGTYFGRKASNEFRFEHRLTTDESIIRTFITSPASTMLNNGAEHVLRCMAKHWKNMLYQENGNFAHQRMEQLNPFEILRFHMPIVLNHLANLRGRNVWDSRVLGPYLRRLQHLNANKIARRDRGDVENANDIASEVQAPCQAAIALIQDMKEKLVVDVCGGLPSRAVPLQNWLTEISNAIGVMAQEAELVREILSSVSLGIRMGYQLLKLVDWSVPPQEEMRLAILDYINGSYNETNYPQIPANVILKALQILAPKDERTLIELVKAGHGSVKAAKLLVGRTCTLLARELRRLALDERIRFFSKGPPVMDHSDLEKNKWYWVTVDGRTSVQLYKGPFGTEQKWIDVDTQLELLWQATAVQVSHYIPVAEAIVRAQKVYMVIELDYQKKFSYNAFMEFGSPDKYGQALSSFHNLHFFQ